jgi:hypothetical protein
MISKNKSTSFERGFNQPHISKHVATATKKKK